MTKLIDSHCHLNYDYAPKQIADLIREAEEQGVEALVTIGTELSNFADVQRISEEFPNVYHTVGVHPHESITWSESDLNLIEKAGQHPKCRAIGEIGLDYHYDHSPREIQRDRLERQLDLALRLNLPIVIHSREGESDLVDALKTYSARLPGGSIPGIIHCFSGTVDFGKQCLDLGFYISFSGILTFKKADEVREAARIFPLDRMLVETDSPYLAPLPFRGKKCEPSMVKLTAQKLAEVKSISFEEVAEATTRNAKLIFRIP
jgi:TatD DNase family protein